MNITNDIITAYIDTFYKNDNRELQELRGFAEKHGVPIIQKDTEGLLLSLLKIKKPDNMLEIGAAVGYSACCFADVCGCRVLTIEADKDMSNIALNNVKNLGLDDKVDVIHGDARNVMSGLSMKFDAVFIDAAKSHYREFWDMAVPLCKDEAMIICDNILMKGMTASDEYSRGRRYKTSIRKMREFVIYINSLDYADTCLLPVGDGVSISVIDKNKYRQGAEADFKKI